MKLQRLKNLFLNTLFPQFCLSCGEEGALVCSDCLSTIALAEYQYCPFCQTSTRVFHQQSGKCPKHKGRVLDGLFSAASYQQPLVKKLIRQFKYPPYLKSLKTSLAYLIIAHFLSTKNQAFLKTGENSIKQNQTVKPAPSPLLMPIPLHKTKQKKRGFNQAELIAKELGLFFKIPVAANLLLKIKKTPSQTELKREERFRNLENAFAINPHAKVPLGLTTQQTAPPLQKAKVFLIDDVFTTGATMEQCAFILKQAGARAVWGITVAREPLMK